MSWWRDQMDVKIQADPTHQNSHSRTTAVRFSCQEYFVSTNNQHASYTKRICDKSENFQIQLRNFKVTNELVS